MKMAFDAQ